MRRFLSSAALTAALALHGCGTPEEKQPPKPDEATKVGFVYIGEIGDYGWSKAHEDGRQYVENFGNNVKTSFVANAGPTGGAEAIEELYAQGNRIIFTTSYDFLPSARAAVAKYSDLTVLNCAGFQKGPRLGSYQSRIEEAEYLSGMLAGRMTTTNKIGVVASQRIYEVIMHVNAFALGVQAVNPDAEVLVRYVGFWLDPAKEIAGVDELHAQGADVFKNFTDTPSAIKRAAELGLYSVSHGSKDSCSIAPDKCLATAYYNWGPLYVNLIDELTKGTYPPEGRIDYASNADVESSGLSPYADAVPQPVRDEVDARKAEIVAGTFNVFQGPFTFEDGTTVPAGTQLTDDELICTSKHVQGVTLIHGPACAQKSDCKNEVLNAEFMDCVAGLCTAPDLGGCTQ